MTNRWNELQAGIILGLVGAVWHIIPLLQAGRSQSWIAGHCFNTASQIKIYYGDNLANVIYYCLLGINTALLRRY